jgi:hypothetical protein
MGVDATTVALQPAPLAGYFVQALTEQWQVTPLRNAIRLAGAITQINGAPRKAAFDLIKSTNLHPTDFASMVDVVEQMEGNIATHVDYRHDCGADMSVPVDWQQGFFWLSGD